LRDIRLTIAPYKPVSSALGILGLLDMMSPPIDYLDIETPTSHRM
jgi:hypothetical protein